MTVAKSSVLTLQEAIHHMGYGPSTFPWRFLRCDNCVIEDVTCFTHKAAPDPGGLSRGNFHRESIPLIGTRILQAEPLLEEVLKIFF